MPQSRKRRTAKRTHTYATGPRTSFGHAQSGGGKTRIVAAVVIFALVAAGAAYIFAPGLRGGGGGSEVTTPSGLKYTDIVVGTGASPRQGQTAVVHYRGTLTNGSEFDSSHNRGQPYPFTLGVGQVIKGWDEGVATMKVGGKRRLVVPPALAYGPSSRPGIPPNSTLVFEVELLDVK